LSIPKLETQSILPDVPGGCFAFIYHDFFFAPVFKHITLLVFGSLIASLAPMNAVMIGSRTMVKLMETHEAWKIFTECFTE